jgi:transposase
MEPRYYIGVDVHKRQISYCVKDGGGRIHAEGSLSATRLDLDHWRRSLPQPWSAAMEATMFTGGSTISSNHMPPLCRWRTR